MKRFESFSDIKSGELKGLRHREDQGRWWWELRPCSYYKAFESPRIIYQAIQYYARYSLETSSLFGNNKTYLIPTDDLWLLGALNAPISWFVAWRHFLHMKDEALSNDQVKMVTLPIPSADASTKEQVAQHVRKIFEQKLLIAERGAQIADWIEHAIGIDKRSTVLRNPTVLTSDEFVSAVIGSLPKRVKLSAAKISELRREHADTLEPARQAHAQIFTLESRVSDLINNAYGLTPKDIALMWRTAPPRMPFTPSGLQDVASSNDVSVDEEGE